MNPKSHNPQPQTKPAVQPLHGPQHGHSAAPSVPAPIQPAKSNVGLILAIIFASAVISGSLVFFGMQLGGKGGGDIQVEKIEKAFESFAQKQQQKQVQDQEQAQVDKEKAVAEKGKANMRPISRTDDHIRGSADAPVSLVEYSDFECPYCKRFDATAKQIIDAYGGKVNWVYRHNPLSFHEPMSSKESMASECAAELGGNDMFWKYNDAIYAMTTSNGNGLSVDDLYKIAADIGLNQNGFETCLDSEKYKSKVQADIDNGAVSGVEGTPGSFLVNNKTGDVVYVEGAQALAKFKLKIDPMLQ